MPLVLLTINGAWHLQFGHGGDAVENAIGVQIELTLPSAAGLQFGHGGDAVENFIVEGDSREVFPPSIRPRR